LTFAIAAATGIESFVWLVDVGSVDRRQQPPYSSQAALLEHELCG
jgi:hypothetical protein